jgi:hypothetical protein
MRLFYLSSLFLLIFSTCIFAQPTTGTIQGTIKLESGEAVADVSVALSNQQTGLTRNATTTAAGGFYRFTALPPGIYSVSAQAKGFGGADSNQHYIDCRTNSDSGFYTADGYTRGSSLSMVLSTTLWPSKIQAQQMWKF